MLRRPQINGGRRGRRVRSSLAAASAPLRDLAGAVEEHVVWRIGDLLRGAVEIARWPFERFAWAFERLIVWPVQERAAGWGVPPRAVGASALAAVAIGAVAIGAVSVSGGEGGGEPVVASAPVAVTAPAPAAGETEPTGPVLQGVPPKFGVGDGVGVATATGGEGAGDGTEASAGTNGSVAGTDSPSTESEGDGATTSSRKPAPAGPAAMKVARRFAEAFVFYEIGERRGRAGTVFEETATPRLATALAERPPRLPESAEVPKARVLNLVPGPRRGRVYTVSASLLRVGVTSELRLKMTMRESAWVVTDVRG